MAQIDQDIARQLLRVMLRIRLFENEVSDRYFDGEIPGFVHLSHGHEGTHAGLSLNLEDDDWLVPGYSRLHGLYIANGVPMRDIAAELYGKRTGPNKGKGGSMHLADASRNELGTAGTIGSDQNPAVGVALAQQYLETGNVVVDALGDGGTSRGTFHTALNFASLWNLPIVFVIDNNRIALSYNTPENVTAENLADYADAFQIPKAVIDGTDPETVYETLNDAFDRARRGDGPTVVESQVYRLTGHYLGDKQEYRDMEEFERLKEEHDPVDNYREALLEEGVLDQATIDDMETEIHDEVEEAIEYARDSEFPAPEEAYEGVYNTPLYGRED